MDITQKPPACLSFCPGFLGLERGLKRVIGDITVLAYVEIEAFIIANLIAGMESGILDPCPVWSNLKTFNPWPFRGRVDFILGGYPCQPFSTAGQRKGADDPRHLWPFIEYALSVIRPKACFFENVPGHLSLGYREVRQNLESMGYIVREEIYSAVEAGASHQRKRLFILAILADAESQRIFPGRTEFTKNERGGQQLAGSEQGCNLIDLSTAVADPNHYAGRLRAIARKGCTETIGGSTELADTGKQSECEPDQKDSPLNSERDTWRAFIGTSATELGDTASTGLERHGRKCELGESQGQDEVNRPGDVADPDDCRSCENTELRELRAERYQQSPSNSRGADTEENHKRRFDRWPARPGETQYDWEEPRTITSKSSLGGPAYGYNFREDLLRAYGNSVVEQTAEIAFRDLLTKF